MEAKLFFEFLGKRIKEKREEFYKPEKTVSACHAELGSDYLKQKIK